MNQNNTKMSVAKVAPVLFGFFVMGFCDIVGVATNNIKTEFNLSESLAGFIPSMVFIWFLLLSVPTAMLMNKIGRKKTVQLSNVITILGMIIPALSFNFVTCMIGFALLGIGNTIIQVSLNPLLSNVVSGNALSSALTGGQVVKAISSFCGPLIASFAVYAFGGTQYIFPIFAVITGLSAIWLMATAIPVEQEKSEVSSVGATFGLLKDKYILLCFLGIMFVVGVDVGMNVATPKILGERCGLGAAEAGLGSSVYFLCRTIGAFVGTFLLAKMADMKYFRIHIVIALAALAFLIFAQGQLEILVAVGAVGYACSSIFSVIFSQAMKARPEKANEISGLMITGVFGGAVVPPVMGFLSQSMGSQLGSIITIIGCAIYLLAFSLIAKARK